MSMSYFLLEIANNSSEDLSVFCKVCTSRSKGESGGRERTLAAISTTVEILRSPCEIGGWRSFGT